MQPPQPSVWPAHGFGPQGRRPPPAGKTVAGLLVLIAGVIGIVVGGVCLAAAAQYEPTFENALFSGGEVLDPGSHAVLQGFGVIVLVLGIGGLIGGVVLMAVGGGGSGALAGTQRHVSVEPASVPVAQGSPGNAGEATTPPGRSPQ